MKKVGLALCNLYINGAKVQIIVDDFVSNKKILIWSVRFGIIVRKGNSKSSWRLQSFGLIQNRLANFRKIARLSISNLFL